MTNVDHSRLRELFDLAMQRPAAERAAFLDGACQGNAALRARIDELVKAAEADGTFLSAPTGEMGVGGTTAREHISMPLVEGPGTRIGLYKLLQLIGEGGFGSVFMAEQTKPVQRRVALKIIKLGMDTRQVIARFEQERQALAIMDHPNIARVLDAGATESGRPFFVMELVKGDTITKFCDAHRLDLKQRLELFLQVCRAVQHAHSKGVIHRDLKPSNIIVSMHDGRAFAKVIDFGIAKATASRLTEKTLFTEHHQLIGTPEYMSPEQAEGSLDIDIRTDVYSLGVLLYELLVGSTPFDAARLRSAAYAELQRIIKEEEPPAPSLRLTRDVGSVASAAAARNVDPSRLGTLIKGELDWIALRCLDKDRGRRYETAAALAQDVERHLSGDAVEAAPPTVWYRVRKFVNRNRRFAAGASAVAITLLVGIATTSTAMYFAQFNARVAINNANIAQSARDDLKAANASLVTQTEAAEWGAYTANLAFAQSSIDAKNWPEARKRLAACPESKRGWEWKFLQAKANSVIAQLPEAAAFTRDGNHIIALGEAPKVYDTAGNPTRPLFGAADTEMGCFFGEDHAFVVTIDGKKTVRLWTLEGAPIGKPLPHEFAVQSVSISQDGQRIATVDTDKTVRLWNLAGMQVGTPMLHNQDVSSVQFSPDGNFVLSRMLAFAQLWTASGSRVGEPFSHTNKLNSAVFSPDGQLVLTAGGFRACLWDLSGKQVGSPMGNRLTVEAAVFSPDGQVVLTRAGNDAFLWNREGASIAPHLSTRGHMETGEFSADGRFVLTASETGLGRLWNLDGTPASPTMRHSSVAAFVPGGKFILTGASDQTIRLRDFGDRQRTDAVELPGYPTSFTFAVNGGYALAHVTSDVEPNYCLLLNLELSGPEIFMNDSSLLPMELASMVPECFASIGTDHHQELPDNSASIGRESGANSGGVLSALVLGDGSRIIKSFDDSTIRFFFADGLREIAVIRIPATAVDMKLSADGSRLVLKYADRTGMIWDIRDPAERLKDREREWTEQPEADKYVESLLSGPLPTPELDAALRADTSLSPLRKLVAWRTLRDRMEDLERDAAVKFNAIATAAIETTQTDKPAILAAVTAAEVAPRVKTLLIAKAEKWEYTPPKKDEPVQNAASNP